MKTTRDFDEFHRRHRDRIGSALALALGDHSLGFEAVDEAMARALVRWDKVGAYDNPEGWVYRTGRNWATTFLRRRLMGWRREGEAAGSGWTESNLPDTDLIEAVAALPPNHREVVVLRFFCDWSVDQTAAALDLAPGTVKSRLARALEQLRRRMAPTDSSSLTSPQPDGPRSRRPR